MQLVKTERKKSQTLAEDYTQRYDRVAGRFDYSPWDESHLHARADWVYQSRDSRLNRHELIQHLASYNERIGNTGSEVLQSLEQLTDNEAGVIVGGQQAGLFTGPLLVIHKAVSIIRLARHASNQLGKPVVPVFWIAGEDHDFDEVNHWFTWTSQSTVERYRLTHPTGLRQSVSRLNIESWTEALEQMDHWLPPSEFKGELMTRLAQCTDQSRTLTDLFARIMAWLFGAYGLLLLDSDDPDLRAKEQPLFQQLLLHNEAVNESLLQGCGSVASLGYQPQAEQAPGDANLFFYNDQNERTLLYRQDNKFTDRKNTFFMKQQQLDDLILHQPERFSNNVMTRPLMQEYVLPVLGTVLGGGEIAYWALTRELFHQFGFRMPVIYPRLEFTLIEGNLHRNMEKFGFTYDDVVNRFDELRTDWLTEQGQYEVEELFSETRRRFLELYRPVLETVSSLNPGLGKLGETNRQKILDQMEYLRGKANGAFESKFESGLRQMDRIRTGLFPLSKPQERVYNVFAYLNKYGTGWIDELITQPYDNDGAHRLILL